MKKKQHIKCKQKQFEIIYHKYADDVYRLSVHMSKDKELAKEITQFAFVELYKCLDDVEDSCIFSYLVQKVEGYTNDVIQ